MFQKGTAYRSPLGCGCPQPACPPPPPAPICLPPQPACSPCAAARGAKIEQPVTPIGLPDELELVSFTVSADRDYPIAE